TTARMVITAFPPGRCAAWLSGTSPVPKPRSGRLRPAPLRASPERGVEEHARHEHSRNREEPQEQRRGNAQWAVDVDRGLYAVREVVDRGDVETLERDHHDQRAGQEGRDRRVAVWQQCGDA